MGSGVPHQTRRGQPEQYSRANACGTLYLRRCTRFDFSSSKLHMSWRGGTGLLEDQTHGGLLAISSQQPYDRYGSNDNAYDDRRMRYNIRDDKLRNPKPIGHGRSPPISSMILPPHSHHCSKATHCSHKILGWPVANLSLARNATKTDPWMGQTVGWAVRSPPPRPRLPSSRPSNRRRRWILLPNRRPRSPSQVLPRPSRP